MRTNRSRVEYRVGQCLSGADLAAQSATADELLALHNARLHQAWGIVTGYECSRDADVLVVAPGLGLDALGRTIVSSRPERVTVPAAGNAVLVAAYSEQPAVGGCDPGAMPLEAPRLRWLRPAEPVRVGLELPIVALRRSGDRETLDLTVRKVAHALVRPKVAMGRVQRSASPVQGTYASWTMPVSTAAGGLTSPSPAYFVTLDQHPWGELANFGSNQPPPVTRRVAEWFGPFVAVESVATTSFTVRVSGRLGDWQPQDPDPRTNPVGLSWIGIDTTYQPFDFWAFLGLGNLPAFLFFGGVQ
jgi:hypothetical protein